MKYSDEQLDLILKQVVNESAVDEKTLDEIADSPQLWWAVQRTVAGERPAKARGWIPTFDWRIAVFASLALGALLIGVFVSDRTGETLNVATNGVDQDAITIARSDAAPKAAIALPEKPQPTTPVAKTIRIAARIRKSPKAIPVRATTPDAPAQSEVKSEFIALMYSPKSDSGQVVKVKVPRSMMVSLGVATNVANAAEYVNAEVLMGDDGSARAIRFVQ